MRWREQRGQVSIEWAGMLALLGLVLAVLWASGLGGRVAGELETAICRVFGGQCGPSPGELADEPDLPCVVHDRDGKLKASVTVFSVKGGGEFRVLRQEMSNGTVLVTMSGGGELGATFGLGAKGSVDVGKGGAGAGAAVSAGVNAQGEGGGTWQFADGDEADEFIEIVRNRARDGAIKSVPGVGLLARATSGLWAEEREVRSPDITYVQAGVGGSASAEAGAVGMASAGVDGALLLGTRIDHRNGERTRYYRIRATGKGSLGVIVGADFQADADAQVAVTYDRDGVARTARIIGVAGLAGGVDDINASVTRTPTSARDWLRNLKLVGQSQTGGRVELQYELALDDPALRGAVDRFMGNPLGGAPGLADQLYRHGELTARVYSTDRDRYGGEAQGALGPKFGVEGSFEGLSSELQGAWYANQGSGGIEQWTTCTGGT